MTDINFTAFNGGEVSPDFIGRVDQESFYRSFAFGENFVCVQTGALRSRGGTIFVAEAKRLFDGERLRRVAMMRFTFSDSDAYIIEIGHLYMRFFKNRGVIEDGGAPYEIASPYTEDELFDSEGLFQIQFDQSNDFLYLAHPTVRQKELTRTSDISWAISDFKAVNGPYLPENLTATTVTYAGGVLVGDTGTLTASEDIFTAAMVGAYFLLRRNVEDVPPWQTGEVYALNALIHNQGLYYLCTDAGTSGAEPPTHDEGSAYDGPDITTNSRWLYVHAGFVSFEITSFTSTTIVNVTAITPADGFPGFATSFWREGAWSNERGFPRGVQLFDSRLWWGGTQYQPVGVYASETDKFNNFLPLDPNGRITATTAFSRQLDNNNPIRWMLGIDKGMMIGTLAGEWLLTSQDLSGTVTALTAQAKRFSRRGAANLYPHQVGEEVIYAQVGRKRVRDVVFNLDKSQLVSGDLNIRADHILQNRVVNNHWAEEPHHILWNALGDGRMAALTYNSEKEVLVRAWHGHRLGGTDAAVEFVEGIPAPDAADDDTWMLVSRTVDGVQRRYFEYLSQPNCDVSGGAGCYLDSALGYNGPPTQTLGGLTHLANETVQVRVDGKNHDDVVVSATGEIQLNISGEIIEAGLYAKRRLILLPIEIRPDRGAPLSGRNKLPIKVLVRVVDSVGGEVGMVTRDKQVSAMVPIEYENALDEYLDAPPVEISGLSDPVSIEAEFTVDGSVVIEQNRPQPLNITQVIVRI